MSFCLRQKLGVCTHVNEWRRAVFGFLVSLTKVKKTVKFGETTSILEAAYLSHKRLYGSLALRLFKYVNPVLNYINTFELLFPSLKISPWTTPIYFLCVTPLSLEGLYAWCTDAGRHSMCIGEDWYTDSAYSGMHTHLGSTSRSQIVLLHYSVQKHVFNIFKIREEQGIRCRDWCYICMVPRAFTYSNIFRKRSLQSPNMPFYHKTRIFYDFFLAFDGLEKWQYTVLLCC